MRIGMSEILGSRVLRPYDFHPIPSLSADSTPFTYVT